MKVSSAPFEAPIGSASRGNASNGLPRASTEKASLHLVSAPTAKSSVKAGLDSATKDALLRLAKLAKEKENEKKNEDEKEKRQSNDQAKRRVNSANVISANDVVAIESVKEFQPAFLSVESTAPSVEVLERVRLKFEAARKHVGRNVYREAVKRQTLVELEKEFNLDLNIDELENFSNEPERSSGKEDALGFYSSGLKRVA